MEFQDKMHQTLAKAESGKDYYRRLALEPVQQALGRVIRGRIDWGSVILLDRRFIHNQLIQYMQPWIVESAKEYTGMHDLIEELEKFNQTEMVFKKEINKNCITHTSGQAIRFRVNVNV